MSALPSFDGLAERLQRARADYELHPSKETWIVLLEAENAWLKRQIKAGTPPPAGWRLSRNGFQSGG